MLNPLAGGNSLKSIYSPPLILSITFCGTLGSPGATKTGLFNVDGMELRSGLWYVITTVGSMGCDDTSNHPPCRGCELVTTLPWFDAGGSSPTSLSLVALAWAETDETLAANNCDTDGKTPRGFCPAMTTMGYSNYLCIFVNWST